MVRRLRWLLLGILITLGGLGALVIIAQHWETSIDQGREFVYQSHQVSLYDKAIAFYYRDREYRRLVRNIVTSEQSPEEAVLALLTWTKKNIRPKPETFPRIDDHPLNIIIRGYGYGEQPVDVFCVLSTYAGYPCQMLYVSWHGPQGKEGFIAGAVNIRDRWVYIDVLHNVYFYTPGKERLADLHDLLAQVDELIPNRFPLPKLQGVPYKSFLASVKPIEHLPYVRGHLQMPLRRLLYEVKLRLGLARRVPLFWKKTTN